MRLTLTGRIAVAPRLRPWPTSTELLLSPAAEIKAAKSLADVRELHFFPLTVPVSLIQDVRDLYSERVAVDVSLQGKHCVIESITAV